MKPEAAQLVPPDEQYDEPTQKGHQMGNLRNEAR